MNSTTVPIRALFEAHGWPEGISLLALAERTISAGVFTHGQIIRASEQLARELSLEAITPDHFRDRHALPRAAERFPARMPEGLLPLDLAFPPPDPPNGDELRERSRELQERYGGAEPGTAAWRARARETLKLEVEDAPRTWAARRCREVLLGLEGDGDDLALPRAATDDQDRRLWGALEDLEEDDVELAVQLLRVAQGEFLESRVEARGP